MSTDWQRKLARERMQVDRKFESRIASSEFSNQEWSLIMTAVEFDVADPDSPGQARLVAITDKIPAVMDDSGARNTLDPTEKSSSASSIRPAVGTGFLASVKQVLGFGEESDTRLQAAETLVQDYADQLQDQLEDNDKWEMIRTEASEAHSAT